MMVRRTLGLAGHATLLELPARWGFSVVFVALTPDLAILKTSRYYQYQKQRLSYSYIHLNLANIVIFLIR